jgi:hypothetical protein
VSLHAIVLAAAAQARPIGDGSADLEPLDSGLLEALFAALMARHLQLGAAGGAVRVYPSLLMEKTLSDCIAVRGRLLTFGLTLVVTPAVGPEPIELKRSSGLPSDSGP